jgi:hypothetical protein
MTYRRPTVYIPPYNYCDRACERCAIDKSKCLLYQTEMDERLHREIDGLGEPTPGETVDRILKDTQKALDLVEGQAREMGMDVTDLVRGAREAGEEPRPAPGPLPPIVEEASLLARGVSAFLRDHGRDFPRESSFLRRYLTLPGAKLGRASEPAEDEFEVADTILQAQVVHRVLAGMAAALESIRRARPSLGDAMLDLLRLMQSLRGEVQARWLSLPCGLLEPAPADAWWGPLRDITPTLRYFRR